MLGVRAAHVDAMRHAASLAVSPQFRWARQKIVDTSIPRGV
jgi:hypothetical protein